MSEIWMFTAPYKKGILSDLAKAWREYDGKKYQIGIEKGRNGYRHVQGRIKISADTTWNRNTLERMGRKKIKRVEKGSHFFDRCARNSIHCTKTEQWSDYEGKEGFYISSDDRPSIRMQRFGELTEEQKGVLRLADSTDDRQVVVWFDQEGKHGKSWLCKALSERKKGYYIDKGNTAQGMVKDLNSAVREGGYREYIMIDIPRSSKWENKDYMAIEKIKDGLVTDPRYGYHIENLTDCKVIVMCNTMPKLDKLSKDRWVFYTAPVGATNTK